MADRGVASPADHEVFVRALLRAPGLPGDPDDRHLVQTHISSLLLAGDVVLKLRKPLALPFLDFSTADQRRFDCEEELRLNRRTAPALYVGVTAIGGAPEAPRLDVPPPQAIDWALVMRRFDDSMLLDRLARAGRLDASCVDALSRVVADFHSSLPPSPPGFGEPAQVRRLAVDNFAALESSDLVAADAARIAALRAWTEREFARVEPLVVRRRADGFVREGHGDLHLGNIVLLGGVPTLFDCIEFNPALRHNDIACDIAFTFMDLWRHDLPGLAWRFVSGWAERCGDYAGLALLRFFAVYRAMVRAKVALLRAGQSDTGAIDAVRRDLDLAERIAGLRPGARRPTLLATCGLSGAGKSTVASMLVELVGAPRLRSDVERKRLHGLSPERPAPLEAVPALYSPAATRRTFDRLAEMTGALLEAGLDVVVDAAFLRREERLRMQALAAAAGAGYLLIECTAPPDTLRQRLGLRLRQAGDPSDADADVLARQMGFREPIGPDEPCTRIDTDTDLATLRSRCQTAVQTALLPEHR